MKTVLKFLPLLAGVFLSACYYDVEEEIYPSTECDTTGITYTVDVLPIIQNNCYSCHSAAANFGGITLEGHSNLQQYAVSGQLLGVIRHEDGFSPMPQNAPQLVECEIEKIAQWISEGAPNN